MENCFYSKASLRVIGFENRLKDRSGHASTGSLSIRRACQRIYRLWKVTRGADAMVVEGAVRRGMRVAIATAAALAS